MTKMSKQEIISRLNVLRQYVGDTTSYFKKTGVWISHDEYVLNFIQDTVLDKYDTGHVNGRLGDALHTCNSVWEMLKKEGKTE